ncbi:hypothetical protein BU23DRAFT_643107 [Bimuria novae-zelandiae CBS 107.79]|uniref:N-acetyltransferase domain-containing protein n=1 Tax=Bimuria novae-zelandiae CBS 107.79 TaxID=1447943 RepID=A0A6A5W1Y6_9PLEO|nr:hypothetical protein BU23DRAFT_643107 [Bimuria novae-zelandiae CBS 107.79]
MAYRLEEVQDSDFLYMVPRMLEAFGNGYEFTNTLYPGHETKAGQSKIVSRLVAVKNAIRNTHWVKAVATASGEIARFAMWTILDKEKPPELDLDGPMGTRPNEEGKEYCRAMHRVVMAERRRVIRDNDLPILILNMMTVFTEHQRQGVGTLLLRQSLQTADDLHALCTVDATPVGKKLYLRGGFVVQRDFYVDAGEKYADRPKDTHVVHGPTGIRERLNNKSLCFFMQRVLRRDFDFRLTTLLQPS